MAKKRISRKELIKGPDEFISQTARVLGWAHKNIKSLIYGAGVFFLVLLIITGYRLYAAKREQAAAVLLSQSLSAYQQAHNDQTDAEQALAEVKPDFEKLIDEYGGQAAGRVGRVIYANIALAGHAPEKAITLYQAALGHFDSDAVLTNVIRNGLATAYIQKGDSAAAIDQFRKIADSSSAVLKDTALFHLGRLYGETGESEKSKKAYEQLRTEFPDSFYAEISQEKGAG